jgi:hypothetical protein
MENEQARETGPLAASMPVLRISADCESACNSGIVLLILTLFIEMWFFRSGKAVEELRGGVAALRRTRNHEDLRSQDEKRPFHI